MLGFALNLVNWKFENFIEIYCESALRGFKEQLIAFKVKLTQVDGDDKIKTLAMTITRNMICIYIFR